MVWKILFYRRKYNMHLTVKSRGCSRPEKESTGDVLFLSLSSKLLSQLLVHRSTMTNRHRTSDSCFLLNGIDDPKTANAVLSQPVELPLERLSTFGIDGDDANG